MVEVKVKVEAHRVQVVMVVLTYKLHKLLQLLVVVVMVGQQRHIPVVP